MSFHLRYKTEVCKQTLHKFAQSAKIFSSLNFPFFLQIDLMCYFLKIWQKAKYSSISYVLACKLVQSCSRAATPARRLLYKLSFQSHIPAQSISSPHSLIKRPRAYHTSRRSVLSTTEWLLRKCAQSPWGYYYCSTGHNYNALNFNRTFSKVSQILLIKHKISQSWLDINLNENMSDNF